MTSTYANAALRIPTDTMATLPKRDGVTLSLKERLMTLEVIAFAMIAIALLVAGVITGVTGVYLLAIVSGLTAANFAATAHLDTEDAIETAPTQLS